MILRTSVVLAVLLAVGGSSGQGAAEDDLLGGQLPGQLSQFQFASRKDSATSQHPKTLDDGHEPAPSVAAAVSSCQTHTISNDHHLGDCSLGDRSLGDCGLGDLAPTDSGTSCGSCLPATCDCCLTDCCKPGPLLGFIQPSMCGFDDFISPMTNLAFFEDPRTLTEARAIFVHNEVPDSLGGGDVQLYALHLRAALSERLSIIATKDGFIVGQPSPLLPPDDGWADVTVGLKYNLYADRKSGTLFSGGLSFEIPVGSTRALQGNGDGVFHPFLSAGQRIGENYHWISAFGLRLPANGNEESTSLYWSNHFDRRLAWGLYPFLEVNWFHWLDSGNQATLNGVEGVDLFNFGSTNVAGNNIVTAAIGLKWKPSRGTELGIGWENTLTSREDILDNRLYVDWILRY